MSAPLVSVLVPTYNSARFIAETLGSLVAQRYPNVEIIVLDDASTDATAAAVAPFLDRVRYVRRPANLGQFANVNAGLPLARGEYVAVFHADDVYEDSILAEAVAAFQRHPGAGAVFCLDVFVDEAGRPYDRLRLPPEVAEGGLVEFPLLLDTLLRRKSTFLRTPGVVARAEVYRELGGYRVDHLGSTADFEMWVRVARRYPIVIVPKHLYRYRHLPTSEGRKYERLRTEPSHFFSIMDEYLTAEAWPLVSEGGRRAYAAHRAEDLLMTSVNAYIRGDMEVARARLRQVRLADLLGSPVVQRGRLTVLHGVLRGLVRLPHSRAVARAFAARWGR